MPVVRKESIIVIGSLMTARIYDISIQGICTILSSLVVLTLLWVCICVMWNGLGSVCRFGCFILPKL